MSITYISHFKYLSTLTLSVLDNITAKKKKQNIVSTFFGAVLITTPKGLWFFSTLRQNFFRPDSIEGNQEKKRYLGVSLRKQRQRG